MHAGLIPIISNEAAVDIGKDEGILLDDCSIDTIQMAVRQISTRSERDLREMSRKAWEFARKNNTMENFEKQYKKTIEKIIGDFEMGKIER
jgi:Fe2+ transport system protein B